MFLAKTSINRPVLTTVGILVFLIFGTLAYFGLNLNMEPEVEIPFITIQTIYPGAGPKEIETTISKKIEDAVASVSQIERIESYSLDGVSMVIMEFDLDKDVNVANQEVKDKVDEIMNDLPEDAEDPLIQKIDLQATPIIDIVLSGDIDPRELYEIADKELKDRFSQIKGVGKVTITGGQEREIKIEFDNRTVYENAISLPQFLQLIGSQNVDIPGGYFKMNDQEFTVRLEGEFDTVEGIEDLQVPTIYGPKKLRQIANIIDGGKEVRQRSTYFNTETKTSSPNVVTMSIIKASDGNVVEVANDVAAKIPEINAILPSGAKLEVVNDRSDFVRSTVEDTMTNIILGVVFTSIILLIFLANIRSTFIVALTMPISIISTFMLIQAAGMTLNIMSLMGLSVSVGVLVANAIVVIENIFRYRELGANKKEAAYKGTSEVTVAVIASTLTNLVVFLPIANMSSIVGMYLRELALAAAFATIFSLVYSFTLTPMLASLILPEKQKTSKLGAIFNAFFDKWNGIYRKFLSLVLKNKLVSFSVITTVFFIFIATVAYYGPKLGIEFIPTVDEGRINIDVELPEGYNLDATADIMKTIEERIKEYPEVVHMVTSLGKIDDLNFGTNMSRMQVRLVDKRYRDIGIQEMIQKFVKDLSDMPNTRIAIDVGADRGAGGAPIQLFLQGQELEKLEEIKEEIISRIEGTPGLLNFDNSSRSGKPEITIRPLRNKLTEANITVAELAYTLRSAIEGMEASQFTDKNEEYDITLTMTDESVDAPEKILNIPVTSSYGMTYRLSQLADIEFTKGYIKILHRDKYTSILFSGAPAAGYPLGDVTSEIDRRLEDLELPIGYQLNWGGSTKMMNEMISDMGFAFALAIILTYLLLSAILESFLQPFFILLTLPLALIGVVSSLYYFDIPFNITSLMAIIMLIGIVVNNAILMLDYTNQLIREQGVEPKNALLEACPTKLKPILMSTIAIILGMLPMAMGIGDAGVEYRIPLGVVSIAGLIVSMFFTLFVVPAFYYLTSRKHPRRRTEELV